MKKLHLLIQGIALLLFISACKKDSNNNNNNTSDSPSIIQITSPAANAIYFNGAVLQVRGNITDINGLSSARLEIKNSGGTVLYQVNTLTGSVTYFNLNWDWTVTGIVGTVPATIVITATDFNSKVISKSVDITLTD
jgi:hypothetical protein